MPADPALGQRIMRRRQVLDMTQEELAQRVGVNRASIGNWESGKHFPKRYLGKLEAVLGIALDPPDDPPLSPEVQAVLDGLTPGQRARAMEQLRAADARLRGREGGAAEPEAPARPRRAG